ncbi:MAG: C25 family cysteine peptidase, partial [Candidatus Baldrarchaeia archaeon]
MKQKSFMNIAFLLIALLLFLPHIASASMFQEETLLKSFEKVVHADYKYLIIVPLDWIDAVYPLAEWKTLKGLPTYIATIEHINVSYAGKDLAWKIREFIKEAYDKWGIQYVLLAGDVKFIPTRYIYNPDTEEGIPSFFPGDEKPTDWYYAGLDGIWDDDGDGVYGESSKYSIKDEMDWEPEVAIGRLPANSYRELETMVNKIITYETNPPIEEVEWFKTAVLCGGPIKLDNGYWQDFGVMVKEKFKEFLPYQTRIIRFYHNTKVNNISRTNLIKMINNGACLVNIDSHGSPRGLYDTEWWSWILPDAFLGASDVSKLKNFARLPLIFAFSCLTAAFDIETKGAWWYRSFWDTSLGEEFVKNPNGGAIAYVGWARVTWTVEEAEELFWRSFFDPDTGNFRPGLALLFSKREFGKIFYPKEDEILRKVYSSWHLLGDPEITIWTDSPKRLSFSYPSKVWIRHEVSIRTVPHATVCILDKKGFYKVLQADSEGTLSFVAPDYETSLSLVLTAHNFLPVVLIDALPVENYVVIDNAFVSDARCDVGSMQMVAFHAKWALDGSDVKGGSIYINGIKCITNGTGWAILHTTCHEVRKLSWTVTGVLCQGRTGYEKLIDDPYIIWDRVKITLEATDSRIDVGSTALFTYSATYEYDNSDATPYTTIALNDTLTKTKVGKYVFEASSITETKYGLSKFTTN